MTAAGGARAGREGRRREGRRGAPRRVLVVWCPDWPPEEGAAARAFEQVVSVVEGFCPRVEVLRPGVCAIGARGPARYFGGEEVLARKIIDAVTRRGFACQVGVADGLFAPSSPRRQADRAGGSWRRARRPRSWPRTRSARWETRTWPTCCPGWASGRWGSSRRCRRPRRRTGSGPRGRSRTGWPAAWIPGRWPPARPRPISPSPLRSTRRPSRPSPWCSRPRRWPSRCTRAWPPGDWPACG